MVILLSKHAVLLRGSSLQGRVRKQLPKKALDGNKWLCLQEEMTRGLNVKRPSPILKVLQKQAVHVVFNISLGHTNITYKLRLRNVTRLVSSRFIFVLH